MNSILEQLRSLPTANLCLYLLGLFAIIVAMAVIHGIKPAYLEMQTLQSEHSQLTRISGKFDIHKLNFELENTKAEQAAARDAMFEDIPDRKLSSELPTILESLHHDAKTHGLRTQKIEPSEIEESAEIASVSLEIQVIGSYANIYAWIEDFSKNYTGVSVSDIRATQNPSSNGNRTLAMNMVIYGR